MFSSRNRYVTRGISEQLPYPFQTLLWRLIDLNLASGKQMDYLQVFEVSRLGSSVQITHRQEVPMRKSIHSFELNGQYKSTIIWVIDSGDYSTMLLPEEY